MARKGNAFRMVLGLLLVTLLSLACAPAAAPTPTPAKAAPVEKAAQPTPAPAKATEAPKAAAPAPAKATEAPKAAAPAPAKKAAVPGTINLATHAVGSLYNAAGTGLAKVLTEVGPIRVIVQPFSGPPGWVPGMNKEGKPETGMINVNEGWQAYAGKQTPSGMDVGVAQAYREANPNLRALAYGAPMFVGLMVRADSPHKTLADIKGLKVTWGFPSFPANAIIAAVYLALGGLSQNDIQRVNVPEATQGQQALVDGRVDVALATPGMPTVAEADAKIGVKFLEIPRDPARLKTAQAIFPGGDVIVYKSGPAGVKQDTPMWGYGMMFAASTHMNDDAAYAITKSMWDNLPKLQPVHSLLAGLTHERFVSRDATIPFHPGAIKFYKEKGVWTKEMDDLQAQLLKGELPFLK
ncbi:MAG: TAXI family TRAP transporter solute-binding subunit [Chloroflexi bacterium]|nr:TAXI family TRAP transporter solute-binding subunit [Chloroflexota bacterium]